MSLIKTRRVMCAILCILFAVGGILFFGTLIANITVLSESYMVSIFEHNDISQQCRDEFEEQLSVLEAESGIPTRVFDAVYNFEEITNDSTISRLYGGHDTTLYTQDTIDIFEQLCVEYLEGNNLQYDEELIHNTALEATRIYSECFGMANTEELSAFITTAKANTQSIMSIGALLIVVPIVLLLILFKKTKDIMFYIFSSLTVQGFSFITLSLASLIFKIGQNVNITPAIYAEAFADSAKGACIIFLIFGAILSAVALYFNVKITKSKKQSLG